MTTKTMLARLAALGLVAALVSCNDGALNPPTATAGALFTSYVAFGNSITAGYQSGGINDSTQREGYPVLLAQQMGTAFQMPTLTNPGCPPPLKNVFTQEPVGTALNGCALRKTPAPVIINDVAVPGAKMVDALTNLDPNGGANPLTVFILGGRTQLEAARAAHPTFVTLWLGNNDALGAALAGDTTLLTDPTTFAAQFTAAAESIAALPTVQGGVLVGVANVIEIPNFSPGVAYFGAKAANQLPAAFSVAANCAPSSSGGVGDSSLVPFSYGVGNLLAQAQAGTAVTLDCVNDAPVLTKAELKAVVAAVGQFNATIAAEADKLGWAYVDPNVALDSLRVAGKIPVFPNTPPSPLAETQPFGEFFSLDGIHPDLAAHKLIADHLIDAINAKYSTSIAHVP